MKDLYVIRHGETEWNTQRRYQGQLDSPLTEKGRSKIEEQKGLLRDLSFSRVYCSPLGRCRQTLELLSPETVIVDFDDRLMEFHLGVLQGKTHDQVPEHHQDQQKIFWEDPDNFDLEGAETFESLEKRASSLLDEIRDQEGPILFVTHTVIIKMLLKILEKRELKNLWDDPHLFPGTLMHFTLTEGHYRLTEIFHPSGQGKPVRNYTA